MSAVDEYHRLMDSKSLKPSKKVTRDAIAELEAELAALKHQNPLLNPYALELEGLQQVCAAREHELAALKARRCETCDDGGSVMGTDEEPRVYCGWHSMWWPSTAYCSQWTAREDG